MAIFWIILIVLFALLFYILAAGGAFRWLRKHDCPFNYPGSTWESSDPRIYLQVVDEIPDHAKAFLILDGVERPVRIHMDQYLTRIDINDQSTGELLFIGHGSFSSERVIITVNKDFDTIYDGEYSTIILYRTDTQ